MITVRGKGFQTNTYFIFKSRNDSGIEGIVVSRVTGINADGTEAYVVVPQSAVTGDVTVFGGSTPIRLQVVPRLFGSFTNADFAPGLSFRFNGRGFVEGGVTINFGALALEDPNVGSGLVDVFTSNSTMSVIVPSGTYLERTFYSSLP
ncbi:MAG: hypothetical protein IIB09_01005 [Bacteroidetes bacterium]|nr:hypothetical protein [Bacteroidota bacterium]